MRLTEIIKINGKEYVNIKGTKGVYANAERKGAPASNAIVRLAAYEDAEEQGKLVILPVKAGDTVYQLRDKKHALGIGVHSRHISRVCVYGNDWIAERQGDKPCAKKDLGKTWFLTREEAEAALKGEREDV